MNELLHNIIPLTVYPITACFIALILTKACIKIMPLCNMIDMPGGRHIHEKPTPKGGGIAIYLAFFSMAFAYNYSLECSENVFSCFFIPATCLVLLGYWDDRYNLPARYKLLGQILVALLCWWMGFKINTLCYWQLPEIISLGVTVIWICGFINAFNLIDGLDGLSAGLSIVAAVCMAVWFIFDKNFSSAVAMLILAGAALGFLRYNFHPAKIFMGDVGSMFIGLTIAVIGMPSSKSVAVTAVLVPLLAAGVPILDVFLAIWRRLVKRLLAKITGKADRLGGVMAADTNHLHHRLLSTVKDIKKTTVKIYFLGIIFAISAIVMMIFRSSAPGVGFVVVLFVFVVLIRRIATIEMWDSANLLLKGFRRPSKKVLLILLHPAYDLAALGIAIYLSMLILFAGRINYNLLIYTLAPVIMLNLISKNYRIFWLRAGSGDYGYLAEIIFLGYLIAFCFNYFLIHITRIEVLGQGELVSIYHIISFLVLSFLCTEFLIVGERLALRHLIFVFLNKIYLQNIPADTYIPKTLVYGGGLACRLLKAQNNSKFGDAVYDFIGIIDDESALRGQYVYGCRVCGAFADITEICQHEQVDKIILTVELDIERIKELKKFCMEHEIELTKFSLAEVSLL